MRKLILISAFFAAAVAAAVIDRTAVAVGTDVITESEVMQEVRVVAFLNGDPLEFTPEARRKAAERLVDQYLIRQEMNISRYPEPENSEAEAMLRNFRRTHYPNDAEYRAALQRYGIAEEQVKAHLLWQLTALRFTDLRFRAGTLQPTEPVRQAIEQQAADRAEARVDPNARTVNEPSRGAAERTALPASVDEQLDKWLQNARSRTRIQYMPEAFQPMEAPK